MRLWTLSPQLFVPVSFSTCRTQTSIATRTKQSTRMQPLSYCIATTIRCSPSRAVAKSRPRKSAAARSSCAHNCLKQSPSGQIRKQNSVAPANQHCVSPSSMLQSLLCRQFVVKGAGRVGMSCRCQRSTNCATFEPPNPRVSDRRVNHQPASRFRRAVGGGGRNRTGVGGFAVRPHDRKIKRLRNLPPRIFPIYHP